MDYGILVFRQEEGVGRTGRIDSPMGVGNPHVSPRSTTNSSEGNEVVGAQGG